MIPPTQPESKMQNSATYHDAHNLKKALDILEAIPTPDLDALLAARAAWARVPVGVRHTIYALQKAD
jgi:uncharacterized iron-regulated protein